LVIPEITKTRTIPNNPFTTNTAKEVYAKNKPYQKQEAPMQPGQTLKLEVFNPPPEQATNPSMPYQPYMLSGLNPTLQQLFSPTSVPTYGPNVQIPMQKVYQINMPGPSGDHVQMRRIYENVLPGKDNRYTFVTLGERLKMYDYVRQILVKMYDGEEISLDSDGQRSLMSQIKYLHLNPNYYSTVNKNPYAGLPFGLLIYNSCFPIKMDKPSQSIICAKDSIGLNIRLYSLSLAEYLSHKLRQPIYKCYDVWRELIYYEYMREYILKKKKSPNFILMYTFFMSANAKIDFYALKKGCLTQKDMLTDAYRRFRDNHIPVIAAPVVAKGQPLPPRPGAPATPAKLDCQKTKLMINGEYLPDEIDPLLQKFSCRTLIVITEAPQHNLYQWSSMIYEQDGIVSKMISHGYHDENVWLSVLFQITSALYVLQKEGIYLKDMSIEDNVYIKDLQSGGYMMGYWIYVIDGISYYVPNYGYLVLIDSNFKDLVPNTAALTQSPRQYKILSSANMFNKKDAVDEIEDKVFQNYRNIINTNAFTKDNTKNNVLRPPESICKLIDRMTVDQSTKKINEVILKHFGGLMNNRIGTYLKKDEIANIRSITGTFKKGELAIQTIDSETYKWVLIAADKVDATGAIGTIQRSTPESNDFVHIAVQQSSLKQYSHSEKIEQNYIGTDAVFSEDKLLETYVM